MGGNSGNHKRLRQIGAQEHYKTERFKIAQYTEAITQCFNTAVRWFSLVCIAAFAYLVIKELSGKSTLADLKLDVDFLAKIGIDRYVSWGACFVLFLAWRRNKKTSKKRIRELSEQNNLLELSIDPKRSSSRINPDGRHSTE